VNDRARDAVAIGARAPKLVGMGATTGAIVAAASESVRQDLVLRAGAAGFDVASLAGSPAALRVALAAERRAWILTGGQAGEARPFIRAALDADVPVLAMIGAERGLLRRLAEHGPLALLDPDAGIDAMRAAAAAIAAGLAVWDPEGAPADGFDVAEGAPLSPREREVLDRVAAGFSNKVIARELELSPNTVKFHLQAAFDKLGVSSRAEAVAVAMRRGEIAV
jgi:DNA-binding CsgD family transcriptional regulator